MALAEPDGVEWLGADGARGRRIRRRPRSVGRAGPAARGADGVDGAAADPRLRRRARPRRAHLAAQPRLRPGDPADAVARPVARRSRHHGRGLALPLRRQRSDRQRRSPRPAAADPRPVRGVPGAGDQRPVGQHRRGRPRHRRRLRAGRSARRRRGRRTGEHGARHLPGRHHRRVGRGRPDPQRCGRRGQRWVRQGGAHRHERAGTIPAATSVPNAVARTAAVSGTASTLGETYDVLGGPGGDGRFNPENVIIETTVGATAGGLEFHSRPAGDPSHAGRPADRSGRRPRAGRGSRHRGPARRGRAVRAAGGGRAVAAPGRGWRPVRTARGGELWLPRGRVATSTCRPGAGELVLPSGGGDLVGAGPR